jgi:hypothetical protein
MITGSQIAIGVKTPLPREAIFFSNQRHGGGAVAKL